MLEIKGISKEYTTGAFTQTALDGVDLVLRDNEFVAILGPSGSGKTTLLNIIGGLDRYDSGDLVVNGKSTKDYRDRDWDTYRNHTIGFVFQSYNLIPHQSVLDNVALALTIGGVSGKEKRERAAQALEKVGLGEHMHKRPNQLSGGQMQRVAIARALVNNPDIVLADEPTGALDTDTGLQVMELLKEVAKDRLVVMVTHNPELADDYATRIIHIKDGKITEDSAPVSTEEILKAAGRGSEGADKKVKRAGMSFPTSFKLSLNNLKTKFGRTFLTAVAGSIGIIGIALILAMSNGVNDYIDGIQRDTMTSYPLEIRSKALDMSSVLNASGGIDSGGNTGTDSESTGLYADTSDVTFGSTGVAYKKNDLKAFKQYIEDQDSPIRQYIGNNGVNYTYNTAFTVYTKDPDGEYINTDDSPGDESASRMRNVLSGQFLTSNSGDTSAVNFSELTPGKDGKLISDLITDNFDVIDGKWPENYDETVLVISGDNSVSAELLRQLGIITAKEYDDLLDGAEAGETRKKISDDFSRIIGREFYLIPASSLYQRNENGTFTQQTIDLMNVEKYTDESIKLHISGIVKQKDSVQTDLVSTAVAYTSLLTDKIIGETDASPVVKAQEEKRDVNVLTGVGFEPRDDAGKAEDAVKYASSLSVPEKASMFQMIMLYRAQQAEKEGTDSGEQMQSGSMEGADEAGLAGALDAWLASDPKQEDLVKLYDNYIGESSYDSNMEAFGKVDKDTPATINIYTDSFDDKNGVSDCISAYNDSVDEKSRITYNDIIGIMTSSMTRIVDVITAVLIGFVSVSLVVSSIMIGIITHISVLERTKEIGILRAMGASKGNISQVFNAETILIGLAAGLIGVGVAVGLTFPMTAIMRSTMEGAENVRAFLFPAHAALLVGLSMLVTFLGGIIPARKAAGKDPVTALRSE